MSIMDIGILTGFAPDQKSLQKVNIVLLYLQGNATGFFLDISVLLPTSSLLENSGVATLTILTLSRKTFLSRGLF